MRFIIGRDDCADAARGVNNDPFSFSQLRHVPQHIHRAVDFTTKRNGEQTVGDELKELYLVTLKYDGRAALFTSSAELVLNQVVDVTPNSDLYYRWKLFDDMKEAQLLVERLKSIDKTIHIPESPTVKRTER